MKKIFLLCLLLIGHLSAEVYTTSHEDETISFDLPTSPEIRALEDMVLYKSYSAEGKRFLVLIGKSKCVCSNGKGLKVREVNRFSDAIIESEGGTFHKISMSNGRWTLTKKLPETNLPESPQTYLHCTFVETQKYTVVLASESTETSSDVEHAAFVASLSVETEQEKDVTVALASESTEASSDVEHDAFVAPLSVEPEQEKDVTVASASESTEASSDVEHDAFVASLGVEPELKEDLEETEPSPSTGWWEYIKSYFRQPKPA